MADKKRKRDEHEDDPYAVLLSASGLTSLPKRFQPYSKSKSSKNAHATAKPSTHDLLLHSSTHPRLDYSAEKSVSPLEEHLSHYIAIYNPESNSLDLQPAYHLSLRAKLRTEAPDEDGNHRRTYAQQREELGREFGTKKAKKAIASKTDNAITKGAAKKDDVQSAILESMADLTSPKKAEAEADNLASKPIPKPNLAAESVEDVYTFNTLIPQNDARLVPVKEWQDKIRDEEDIRFNHRCIAIRLKALATSDNILKLKALAYLSLLLEFHDSLQNAHRGTKKVPKKDVLSKKLALWPEALVDSVRRRFSNADHELPKWHLDNLYTHIAAVSLYIDGFVSNMTSLREDLKMENKQLAQYFIELGCKVTPPNETYRQRLGISKAQAATVRIAALKLPLELPKPRAARRR